MRDRSYVCGSKSILIQKPKELIELALPCGRTNGLNACPRCKAKRVDRIEKQVIAEQWNVIRCETSQPVFEPIALYWNILPAEKAARVLDRLRHTGARWKRLPLEDDREAIIANTNQWLKGALVPCDKETRRALIEALAETPGDKRMGSSRGSRDGTIKPFGKDVANLRSKSTGKAYIVDLTPNELDDVLAECGIRKRYTDNVFTIYDYAPGQFQAVLDALGSGSVKFRCANDNELQELEA
jgi:hypothetical protein